LQQAHLEPGRRALGRGAGLVPYRHRPVDALARSQLLPGVLDVDGLDRRKLAAVPQVGFTLAQQIGLARSKDAVRGLARAAPIRVHLPAQPGDRNVDTQRVGSIFTGKVCNLHESSSVYSEVKS